MAWHHQAVNAATCDSITRFCLPNVKHLAPRISHSNVLELNICFKFELCPRQLCTAVLQLLLD